MRLLLKYLLFILLPAYTYGQSGRPDAGITFEVTDSLHNPLAYATVALTPMSGGGKAYATTTDEEGRARFTLPANTYNADISYIGYVSQRMEVRPVSGSDMLRTVRLRTSDTQIREVVITATQVRGRVSGTCSNCCPADGPPTPRFPPRTTFICARSAPRTAITRLHRSAFRSSWTEFRCRTTRA